MATKPVIVGVDGSQESLRAVQWAALEARRHGSVLRIVSAPGELSRLHAYRASPGEIAAALRGIAARSLDAAITRSEEVAPGLPIETGLLSGPSAVAVADSGAGASMLVVGARGAGGFAAMMLGSVSRHVAAWAPCPVVVVREEATAVHREIASPGGELAELPTETTDFGHGPAVSPVVDQGADQLVELVGPDDGCDQFHASSPPPLPARFTCCACGGTYGCRPCPPAAPGQ